MKRKVITVAIIFVTMVLISIFCSTQAYAMPVLQDEETLIIVDSDTITERMSEYVSPTQLLITEKADNESATARGYCAQWVMNAYKSAGFTICGNACDLWAKHCDTNIQDIQPGMIIAVQHSGPSGDSWTYGHVGIYLGNGEVIHSIGKIDRCSLEDWVKRFDYSNTVMCGYPDEVEEIIGQEFADYEHVLRNQKRVEELQILLLPMKHHYPRLNCSVICMEK